MKSKAGISVAYVVEVKARASQEWILTARAASTRKIAREYLREWKIICPDDKFRIRKYVCHEG